MPTAAVLYKRTQRRLRVPTAPPTSTASTPSCSSPTSTCSSSSSVSGCAKNCFICKKDIKYFKETLSCRHDFHADCYWRWIVIRSNIPEEKSICPRCGFLDHVDKRRSGLRLRKTSTTTSSSSSSGDDDSSEETDSSSTSTSSSSSLSSSSSNRRRRRIDDLFF